MPKGSLRRIMLSWAVSEGQNPKRNAAIKRAPLLVPRISSGFANTAHPKTRKARYGGLQIKLITRASICLDLFDKGFVNKLQNFDATYYLYSRQTNE